MECAHAFIQFSYSLFSPFHHHTTSHSSEGGGRYHFLTLMQSLKFVHLIHISTAFLPKLPCKIQEQFSQYEDSLR